MTHAAPSLFRPMASRPSAGLKGRVRLPGDKSISHRALMFGALATGVTEIEGLLLSADVLGTAAALEAMGVPIMRPKTDDPRQAWRVYGRGIGGLSAPAGPLDFGNSGTGARLMMGILAGQAFPTTLTGDESLSRRPMGRVLKPLQQMGLTLSEPDRQTLPLTIIGTPDLIPIRYVSPVASAQVKSAILLAGLHASGETTVVEAAPTRDHTERMLAAFGWPVRTETVAEGLAITVRGDAQLHGQTLTVPGDPSSAAFVVAAALIAPDSDLTVENVLVNPTRTGFYLTLQEMGADIVFENGREVGGEPVADIRVRSSSLKGVAVPAERAPSMIDEYPILAVVASFAHGTTRMDGLDELKVKESDRLAATWAGLRAAGVAAEVEDVALIVHGGGDVAGGGQVTTHYDHRIAMAFLVMGLAAQAGMSVDDTRAIDTSFPEFADVMTHIGAEVSVSAATTV